MPRRFYRIRPGSKRLRRMFRRRLRKIGRSRYVPGLTKPCIFVKRRVYSPAVNVVGGTAGSGSTVTSSVSANTAVFANVSVQLANMYSDYAQFEGMFQQVRLRRVKITGVCTSAGFSGAYQPEVVYAICGDLDTTTSTASWASMLENVNSKWRPITASGQSLSVSYKPTRHSGTAVNFFSMSGMGSSSSGMMAADGWLQIYPASGYQEYVWFRFTHMAYNRAAHGSLPPVFNLMVESWWEYRGQL